MILSQKISLIPVIPNCNELIFFLGTFEKMTLFLKQLEEWRCLNKYCFVKDSIYIFLNPNDELEIQKYILKFKTYSSYFENSLKNFNSKNILNIISRGISI